MRLFEWEDPLVAYGLAHKIKYARLIVRQASSPRAHGADRAGQRYSVQLALSGVPSHNPKHPEGLDTVGLDLTALDHCHRATGRHPTRASCCAPSWHPTHRRSDDSSVRWTDSVAPTMWENFDERGRIKKGEKGRLSWKPSLRPSFHSAAQESA